MISIAARKSCAALALILLTGCGAKAPSVSAPQSAATPTSLGIETLKPGSGVPIVAGQRAVVDYTGWLYEASAPDKKGAQFDSSVGSGQPFRFEVGNGQVIKGWDQGVLGMKVGERRRLVVPAELGYGELGAGGVIPPGAVLIFDVELQAIE